MYLGVCKTGNYGNQSKHQVESATFEYPPELTYDAFALRDAWTLNNQDAIVGSSGIILA
ncbi:hypothetical protein [Mycobacterium uberis]|uniref:hypothetical protein n=1 Tax=Mycobacterium uberis TaxID=2162698 RepID=UPI001FB55DE4|nr:hypothetical protein [Mycobacterium uberis]